ncbi:MAG: ATP synthase F1 subunit epsilon [Fusobacterium sp.]|uniref:ATP synthase F1 subunit epsilon n=1 Tax=Fusobacterium sp. TaxID=68766 RepID=UPI0026DAD1A7|nr:ATP synthase F1 subunit epsilon [Fusobacterium sp.]MDO4690504.1 ATP synthase F1 subunit epsilon [Fusobacterium sp.]
MPNFKVKVVTHTKKVIEREADYLRVRTTEGDLGILANHAPLVAELAMGQMEIEYKDKTKRDAYFVSGGFLEISNNEATVIADELIAVTSINIEKEEAQIEKIKNLIEKGSEKSFILEKKLKESQAKIELKNSYSK